MNEPESKKENHNGQEHRFTNVEWASTHNDFIENSLSRSVGCHSERSVSEVKNLNSFSKARSFAVAQDDNEQTGS